ncbi:GNAT family N-acetyltransferase [Helcococcus ovis]|uniref:GNAT family N-acetyltransferase n=2 Tax=Helcococcus ovis TaxID=72026 RepID=A0A4R9C3Q2_9FIRM|nr:GNAT family N-acetyltransferase [Helcococcus ovis]TFF63848.1 GNAT family N-acetyltransferase [Helcococcus ovis]TFF67102.1 GNAT family N-acetyltransferase [Helcococcus ovis]
MNIELIEANEKLIEISCFLIKQFWKEHNGVFLDDIEIEVDYKNWTDNGHKLFLVKVEKNYIGFAHLGNRGAKIDWLEDIFIIKEYQNNGIGSKVIKKLEKYVKEYSQSLYIEVAARNLSAMRLYNKLGYDCLNTITIRKDFNEDDFDIIKREKIDGYNFNIKKYKKSTR